MFNSVDMTNKLEEKKSQHLILAFSLTYELKEVERVVGASNGRVWSDFRRTPQQGTTRHATTRHDMAWYGISRQAGLGTVRHDVRRVYKRLIHLYFIWRAHIMFIMSWFTQQFVREPKKWFWNELTHNWLRSENILLRIIISISLELIAITKWEKYLLSFLAWLIIQNFERVLSSADKTCL